MFEDLFVNQLGNLIGQPIEVATEGNLFDGVLIRVTDGLVELSVSSSSGYERENRIVTLPVTEISYVRVVLTA